VLASRQRRSGQLEKLLVNLKQQIADHDSGDRILSDVDKAKVDKKVDIFQKKLDSMKEMPDEREIERILKREKLMKERQKERFKKTEL
jgi:hypothetical protein